MTVSLRIVIVAAIGLAGQALSFPGGGQLYAEYLNDHHLKYGPPAHSKRPTLHTEHWNAVGMTGFTLNPTSTCDFSHFFEGSVGSGHMALAMRQDYREHLTMAARDLGVKRVRGHGLLDDDMSVSYRSGVHSFYNIDNFVDFLLSIDMRPLFELSFMPEWLASGTTTVCHYKGNNTPPKNYTEWEELINAFASHMVERYGEETASEFRFEVWNEPNDGFWAGTQEEYFKLYQHAAWGIKNASTHLKVGGPATNSATTWLADFQTFCSNTSTPFDFISSHDYSSCGLNGLGDVDKAANGVKNGRQLMPNSTEWLITEYGASCTQGIGMTSEPSNDYHDMVDQAAYTIAVIDRAANYPGQPPHEPQALSYWAFSDVFEEEFFPVSNESFHGMFGLINLHGVPKPTYRAYQLLHDTPNKRLDVIRPGSPSPGTCGRQQPGVDYYGGDIGTSSATSAADCCQLCLQDRQCSYYSYHIDSNQCGLKNGDGNQTANPDRISGSIVRLQPTVDDLCALNTGVLAVTGLVEIGGTNTTVLDLLIYNHAGWSAQITSCNVSVALPPTVLSALHHDANLTRIDETHSNPLAAWIKMGAPNYTTAGQDAELLNSSMLNPAALLSDTSVAVNASALSILIPPHGIAAVRIAL